MPLDYGYTCPTIDKLIDEAKDVIFEHIQGTVLENNPYVEEYDILESVKAYIKGCSDNLYSELEDIFEGCRKTNEDMRKAADDQINDLESYVEDLKYEIGEWERNE